MKNCLYLLCLAYSVWFTFGFSVGNRNETEKVGGYDQPSDLKCPPGQMIYSISSNHSLWHRDRTFSIYCRESNRLVNQTVQTNYTNDYDQSFDFKCPENYVLSGIQSIHSNKHEDRIFKFTCTFFEHECYWTAYTQSFKDFTMTVPRGFYFKGVKSDHNNLIQDRQFSFYMCKMRVL